MKLLGCFTAKRARPNGDGREREQDQDCERAERIVSEGGVPLTFGYH